MSSLRAELAAAHDARAAAFQSQQSEVARSASLSAQLETLRSEADEAGDLGERARELETLSSTLRAEASFAEAAASRARAELDAVLASRSEADARCADASARAEAATASLAAEQAARAECEAKILSLSSQLSRLTHGSHGPLIGAMLEADSQPEETLESSNSEGPHATLAPHAAAGDATRQVLPRPLSSSTKPREQRPRILSWGAIRTHEIEVTQAEKDEKRDTFRRIMRSSDEEQRLLHEEILALRQQLGQEAIAAISSSSNKEMPTRSSTNQSRDQTMSAGHVERVSSLDGNSVSGSNNVTGGRTVGNSVPRMIEVKSLAPESVGPSRQVQLRATDGTRYTIAAPHVEPGADVRLTMGEEDHGGGRHAGTHKTAAAATGPGMAGGGGLPAGKISSKSHVDEELSETEALVAKMRLELGLGSDTTGSVGNLRDSGSG